MPFSTLFDGFIMRYSKNSARTASETGATSRIRFSHNLRFKNNGARMANNSGGALKGSKPIIPCLRVVVEVSFPFFSFCHFVSFLFLLGMGGGGVFVW